MQTYDEVTEAYPHYSSPYLQKATIYSDLNYHDSTLLMIDKYLQLNSENNFAWYLGGNAFKQLNQTDSAIQMFEKSISLKKNIPLVYFELAELYLDLGMNKEAKRTLRKMMVAFTATAVSYYLRGKFTLKKLNDTRGAVADFNKALEWDDQYAPAVAGIGDVYLYHRGSYTTALKYYKKAVRIDSTKALYFVKAGRCCYLLNDFDQCITFSEKAITLDSTICGAWFNMAIASLRQGHGKEARAFYQQALKEPQSVPAEDKATAIKDLNDLIARNEWVDEARDILEDYFEQQK